MPFGQGSNASHQTNHPILWGRSPGALQVPAKPISAVADGTSNTIMFIEDTGREHCSQVYQTYSKIRGSRMRAPTSTGAAPDSLDCTAALGDPAETSASGHWRVRHVSLG